MNYFDSGVFQGPFITHFWHMIRTFIINKNDFQIFQSLLNNRLYTSVQILFGLVARNYY